MKNFLMFLLSLFISIPLNAQLCKKVTWPEYVDMLWKYAEAFTTNKSPELASFHEELGEDDESLQVFVLGEQEGMFWLFVKQGDFLEKDTLDFYPITIPDTVSMYVYSSKSNFFAPFLLYQSPSRGRLKEQCDAYIANPLRIIDVCGTWLKVRFEVSGKVFEGWIPPEEYCSNPYSTCN